MAHPKHGLCCGGRHPLYESWLAMRQRCLNARHHAYGRYGGRGISICARWDDFATFVADMGPRPSEKHSVDRINNDGNYEPGNCRWATAAEQSAPGRRNIDTAGEKNGACKISGLTIQMAKVLLANGWPKKAIADRFSMSTNYVQRVAAGTLRSRA